MYGRTKAVKITMRIGIDGRALQFRSWGGVRHYTLEFLQALFTIDHANEYHVFYNAWKKIEVPRFSEFPNVHVHYSRWPNKFFNLSIKLFHAPAFRPPDRLLDVLFVPNLNFVVCKMPTKLVAVVHDLSFEHFPEHFPWRFRLWHRTLNPRSLLQHADHIIAVSEHTKRDLMETYALSPERISVIYPGIADIRYWRLDIGQQISNIKYPISEAYILYFGALEPRKNIEGLIGAYELLEEEMGQVPNLVIAGLTGAYTSRLKKRIRESQLRTRMYVKENPSEEEKATLYANASLFVYPSFYEGFGFPPLEAMARGVPVVASSASSVPEVCGQAALLVNPWNVSEIKTGMKILLEDSTMRQKYIASGRAHVHRFSWTRCAQHTLEIVTHV